MNLADSWVQIERAIYMVVVLGSALVIFLSLGVVVVAWEVNRRRRNTKK